MGYDHYDRAEELEWEVKQLENEMEYRSKEYEKQLERMEVQIDQLYSETESLKEDLEEERENSQTLQQEAAVLREKNKELEMDLDVADEDVQLLLKCLGISYGNFLRFKEMLAEEPTFDNLVELFNLKVSSSK